MESIIGTCEYCGTEMTVLAETKEEADDIVSKQCYCGGKKIAEKKKYMKVKLQSLVGDKCASIGFEPVGAETYKLIEKAAMMVIEGELQNVQFKVRGTVISIKAGEKTKISRKYTYEQKGEVE